MPHRRWQSGQMVGYDVTRRPTPVLIWGQCRQRARATRGLIKCAISYVVPKGKKHNNLLWGSTKRNNLSWRFITCWYRSINRHNYIEELSSISGSYNSYWRSLSCLHYFSTFPVTTWAATLTTSPFLRSGHLIWDSASLFKKSQLDFKTRLTHTHTQSRNFEYPVTWSETTHDCTHEFWLTHCGLVTLYEDIDLAQQRPSWWPFVWRYQGSPASGPLWLC